MRNSGLILGILALVLVCCPILARAQTSNVSILYTGDTQGHLRNFYYDSGKPVGGIAKRAIYFQEKRRHTTMAWLTLDAGDALSGTALSNMFKGYLDVQAMNKLKYDAMVLGVHDFDYGVPVLRQRISEANFSVLAANVIDNATGQPFAKPYVIIERNGVRMAVIGLTTADLTSQVAPENFSGLSVRDPIETCRELLPEILPKADIIVALTHLGIYEDIKLSSQFQEIDVIVGGKSHAELAVPMRVGRCMIVHGMPYGLSVGLLKLSFQRQGNDFDRVWWDGRLVPMDSTVVDNTDYQAWLDEQTDELFRKMNVIAGESSLQLSAVKVRSAETALGNYVADVVRSATGADLAIVPAGYFVGDLPQGPLSWGDLFTAMPSHHYASVLTVSGGELKEIFRDAAKQIGRAGFPQVSGVNAGFGFNGSVELAVGGQPVDDFARYTVATTDFAADGNLGYATMGRVSDRRDTGKLVRDMVAAKLSSGYAAVASVEGRIKFLARNAGGTPTTTTPQQPAYTPPATDPTPPAYQPPAVQTPPAGSDSGLTEVTGTDVGPAGTQRYDRTGEPIRVEDELIRDTGSDLQPADTTAVPQPGTTPPVVTPLQPTANLQGTVLAETSVSAQGLDYNFTVLATATGFSFRLIAVNNGGGPLELNYPTSEVFDFGIYEGTNLLWNFHRNYFFVQSQHSETLQPGEYLELVGTIDSATASSMLGRMLRVEGMHNRSEATVRIPLDVMLPN